MNDDPKVLSAVYKRKLDQYPVGREFSYLGIKMRVTRTQNFSPIQLIPYPTFIGCMMLDLPSTPAELHADYVNASGEICTKKFIGSEILILD